MSANSKAIAGFLSSALAMLVTFNVIEPNLAEMFEAEYVTAISTIIAGAFVGFGVWVSPKNKE